MGALILESAFLALLREHPESLIQPSQPGQGRFQLPVRISIEDQPVTFPDLVLLLNSAAGSEVATDLSNGLKKVRKFVELGQIGFRLPLVISATSSQDFVTRILWRFGNWPWRKTEGHNSSLRTHTLVCTGEERRCLPKQDEHLAVSFGQAWHCLRWPPVKETDRPSFPIDLPKTMSLRENEQQKPQHIRYLLKPLGEINRRPQQGDPHPFWLVQLPPEISHDHNDIFNFRSSLLILALMQISGAVVSLAKKWEDAFEEETP